ncbi:uncharacterized protein PG998_000789 [Apiospora kogelbergensis]|uniref:uncharacterized protein n=1 Tax=Apiospora kogelbergensis TaxID=1337665 RepID=UPI0031322AD8
MSENQRFKVTQEENCVLLTQKQNELESRKGDMVRCQAELEAASKETDLVRKGLEASRESVRQELAKSEEKVTALETERQSTSSRVTDLMTTIKKWEEEARQWREKAVGHEKSKIKADDAALKAQEELKATKQDLISASSRLEKLQEYSYPFQEAKWEKITRSLQSLFLETYNFINAHFSNDLNQQVLADMDAWSELLNHKSILRVLPLPRSNSAPAKQMRVSAVLCVLATSLTEHLFQPTYLLEESNELSYLLDDILQTDPVQERHLRAQLLCFDPEQQKSNGNTRVESVVVDVFNLVGNIILPTQQFAFRKGLETLCESAREIWAQIQQLGPRVEPAMEVGRADLWRLLPAPSSAPNTAKRASHTDIKIVVWPGFIVADSEGVTMVSEGFVVAESQTQAAAREEVAEAIPDRHRSARRKQRTLSQQPFTQQPVRSGTNGDAVVALGKPFLSLESEKQSSGG